MISDRRMAGLTMLLGFCAGLLVTLFAGCRQIEPYFNMRPVEIVDYAPRARFVEPDSVREIELRFSAAMNRTLTETALRIETDGGSVAGRFSWRHNDTVLAFRPYAGFPPGARFNVTVSDSAEDRHGNNLLRELVFDFRTGDNERAPFVVRHYPPAGSEDTPEIITLEFSEPMQRDSVYRALSISPRITTAASWSDCATILNLTPTEPFSSGTRYEVHLGSEAKDLSGNQLPQELRFAFRAGARADASEPIVRLQRDGTQLSPMTDVDVNRVSVEKDERFEIQFADPVPGSRRGNAVTLSPTVTVALEWNPDYTGALVRPLALLDWQELYELNVLGTRFRFLVDGPDSQPIRVDGVALRSSEPDDGGTFTVLTLGDTVALFDHAAEPGLVPLSNEAIALDFVLRHAPSATVSRGSMMSSFRIGTSGGSITFAARELIVNPGDSQFAAAPNQTVVRFLLSARHQGTLPMDLLSIELRPGVHDCRRNRLHDGFRLEVNAW